MRVELAGSIRELAAQHPETQADIEAALHGYVDRLSTCRGVLSTALLQHYEVGAHLHCRPYASLYTTVPSLLIAQSPYNRMRFRLWSRAWDAQCDLAQPWPESQPEPAAGEPTGVWTLRCQLADHATLPLPGPSASDPLDLGVPQSLRETLSVDERGLGPGTYACHLHF